MIQVVFLDARTDWKAACCIKLYNGRTKENL